jgi:hypothetical protein
MKIDYLSRPTRRFLSDRLDRLHNALESLGQRLREGIAHLVGSHIGVAVRDALASALQHKPQLRPIDSYPAYDRADQPHSFRDDSDIRQDFWHEREYESLPPELEPAPKVEPKPRRWQPLLTGGVQLASWWLQHRPTPRSLKRVLVIGTVTGVTMLVAGPLIGGIVAVAGTAFLLMRMADTASHAAGRVAAAATP